MKTKAKKQNDSSGVRARTLITEKAWMLENSGVLVYPTLRQTRKDCIREWCLRHGHHPSTFGKLTNYKCVKVQISKAS